MAQQDIKGLSFQKLVFTLQDFWSGQGCVWLPSWDMEMGAGTFHPGTVFRTIGPDPWKAMFVQPSRRPADGRYGQNPNRLYRHHQFQVLLKPAPENIQEIYLKSLEAIGLDPRDHDIRFVEDDWESPTMGASGLGWEVWCDGMEITQFTYFQMMGSLPCDPVTAELTIGLERLCMFLQGVDNVYELRWEGDRSDSLLYDNLCRGMEAECSAFAFEHSDADTLRHDMEEAARTCEDLARKNLVWPAYEHAIKASHLFNMLDARGAVNGASRVDSIARIRQLVRLCCETFLTPTSDQDTSLPHA
jgi:glycyl-tRNA synthetase alpha chain